MPDTIDRDTLAAWLRDGREVTILDLQPEDAFGEWHVPGSRHVPAYEALKRGDASALDEVAVPEDRPVVTVCPRGRTSALAAERLRSRGLDARSLEGGLRAWSLAWNLADVPVPEPRLEVVQVRRTGKGCLSYLIVSSGEAAVVDASLEPEVYLRLARQRGVRIRRVLETHVQADHLSRGRALAAAAGADLHLPDQQRVRFPFTPAREGDVIRVGDAEMRVLHTPGHTPESTSYRLGDALLFTGDTLFLDGVGRPDLDAGREEAEARARQLYASLRRLLALPDRLRVLPAHTARPVPFDGEPLLAPVGHLRDRHGGALRSEADFVTALLEALPAAPANFGRVLAKNEEGRLPPHPQEWEAGANRCAAPVAEPA